MRLRSGDRSELPIGHGGGCHVKLARSGGGIIYLGTHSAIGGCGREGGGGHHGFWQQWACLLKIILAEKASFHWIPR